MIADALHSDVLQCVYYALDSMHFTRALGFTSLGVLCN